MEVIELINSILTLRILGIGEDNYFILAIIICAIGTLADWYTTKRNFVDKNLKLLEQNKPIKYKEANIILRWILASPDPLDEWRIGAYKLLFIIGFFIIDAPIESYMLFGISGILIALSNKFYILPRIIDFFKERF